MCVFIVRDTELRCFSDVSQLLTGVLTLPYTVIFEMSIWPTAPQHSATDGNNYELVNRLSGCCVYLQRKLDSILSQQRTQSPGHPASALRRRWRRATAKAAHRRLLGTARHCRQRPRRSSERFVLLPCSTHSAFQSVSKWVLTVHLHNKAIQCHSSWMLVKKIYN